LNIVHFHNGFGGGVLTVIRNLVQYRQHPEWKQLVIYTLDKKKFSAFSPMLPEDIGQKTWYYSRNWNFYYTAKQLAKLLPPKDTVLIAHDWLELAMISNLGLNYPVVQFLHGDYDYYYNLAQRNQAWVDSFICVSASIADELKRRMPDRSNDIQYLRFPVLEVNGTREDPSTPELVFAGRCDEAKGYDLLPLIDAALQQKNIHAHWHIAGPGSDQLQAQQQWKQSKVHFYGNLSQKELTALLLKATAFVLPSLAEGMPVSVVEAMKAGAIPVVNDLNGGLRELVTNDVTGYRIPNNDPLIFAERIAAIVADAEKRKQLSVAAVSFANTYFDPVQNTKLFEDCFIKAFQHPKKKTAFKTTGSRLDQPYLPNLLVKTIRSLT
jgi:glycosyltransferase involved in cell wall biosynthesis